MKKVFIGVLTLFLLTAFSSCKQCQECVNYPGKDIKLCKKDYASDESYTEAYRYLVSQGYQCK